MSSRRRTSIKRPADSTDPLESGIKRSRAEDREPTGSPSRRRRGASQAPQKEKSMKMKLVGTAEPFDEVQFVHPDALRLFEVAEVLLIILVKLTLRMPRNFGLLPECSGTRILHTGVESMNTRGRIYSDMS
jgi:hypothetical protein